MVFSSSNTTSMDYRNCFESHHLKTKHVLREMTFNEQKPAPTKIFRKRTKSRGETSDQTDVFLDFQPLTS